MSETRFIEAVQGKAGLDSPEQAEQLTRATLRTLGEAVSEGMVDRLSEDLPEHLAEEPRRLVSEEPEPLPAEEPADTSIDDFLTRLTHRTEFDRSTAQRKAVAVTKTLQEVGDERTIREMHAQLPSAYGLVLPAGRIEGEFAEAVYERGDFDSIDEARAAARATLEALGERIALGEARDLAAYLPEDAAEWIVDETVEEAQSGNAREFARAVADEIDVDESTARDHIRAVTDVLDELVSDVELERARAQLGSGYDSLFASPD